MTTPFSIADDLEFYMGDRTDEQFFSGGRFSTTKVLRTVAAVNPDATRAMFLAGCALAGVCAATATKQFGLSRRFSVVEFGDCAVLPDGRLVDL